MRALEDFHPYVDEPSPGLPSRSSNKILEAKLQQTSSFKLSPRSQKNAHSPKLQTVGKIITTLQNATRGRHTPERQDT